MIYYSFSKENYIKAIYNLSNLLDKKSKIKLVMLANILKVNSASVSSMIKKLIENKYITYNKITGIKLTIKGQKLAIKIIRAHRLWEFFLEKKLFYKWDEIHEIADQLEHIKAPNLLEKLESYLNYPQYDPHGDPIPHKNGFINISNSISLYDMNPGILCKVIAVKDSSKEYLQYLHKLNIHIGDKIMLLEKISYDDSIIINIKNNYSINVSQKFAKNLLVIKYI